MSLLGSFVEHSGALWPVWSQAHPFARERLKPLLTDEPDVLVAGEARDGLEAIASLRANPIDLLFLDIPMPGMTGLEVAIEVGAHHLPPTIFITAISSTPSKPSDWLLWITSQNPSSDLA